MSVEGLRAWIGEVERKLGKRTRVFLALAVIAIGIAGAAVYLAIDARESSVSESDVQELQQQLEAQIGEGGGGPTANTEVARLEAELNSLKAEVEALKGKGGGAKEGSGGASSGSDGTSTEGTSAESANEAAAGEKPSEARIKDLLEQAKKGNEATTERQPEK